MTFLKYPFILGKKTMKPDKQIRHITIKVLTVIAVIILFYKPAISKNFLLEERANGIPIGRYLDYLEDKEHALSIQDVHDKKLEHLWHASQKDAPGFGFTKSAYWVRFTIENTTGHDTIFFLEQSYPLIDDLKIYVPERGAFRLIEVGDHRKFSKRPYDNRTFIIPLQLKSGELKTYYLRYNTQSSMNMVLRIWDPQSCEKTILQETRFLMLYYGIVLVMIIYNLFVYFFVRRIEYLYYVFFILFFLIFIMTQNGTAFQFLWPSFPWWANYFIPISLCLLVINALLFADRFMIVKKISPLFHWLANILIAVTALDLLLCLFMPYRFSMVSSAAITVVALLFGIMLGIRMSLSMLRTAYFFVIAWIIFLVGSLAYVLMTFGVFPSNFFTDWSIQIGSALQVILLAIALADRMNIMRTELKTLNENLEDKVTERTEELYSANEELKAMNVQLIDTRDQLWGEMQLAKKIQKVLLPQTPSLHGYEISAYMEPANEVGGDYYDILHVAGLDWIVIGDVSGHGVPAGLIMMMVQTSIHTAVNHNPSFPPSELLTLINRIIIENIKKLNEDKYMTLTVFAVIEKGKFQFSGLHQDIMIRRAETGMVDLLETSGMWLGIMDEIGDTLTNEILQINIGDTILLYTDGITEAWKKESLQDKRDPSTEMFGEEKLLEIFQKIGDKPVDEIKERILSEIKNGYTCNDDITMLIMRRLH
ncbi:MAG: SpoIIE family protein phosphatase [Spirochaetes bacterium]|nr:SpoIIE family protein phosphatase [Spirochaetota bacterium]